MEITSTEAKNNFGQYMKFAMYEDIIVTRNGRRVLVLSKYDKGSEDAVKEETEAYQLESSKLSYEEFLMLSEGSDERYEYIDGYVYLLASPTFEHQNIIMETSNILFQWFGKKKCRPLTAPFDITLIKNKYRDNINVVQPDIVVICDTDKITDKGKYTGIPSLVVEVLSPSNKSMDMVTKLDLYINSGVKEYWIIDPLKKEVYEYSFNNYKIEEYMTFKNDDILKSVFFEGLELPLSQVFAVR